MSSATEALARRWFAGVWNQRRAETIEELLSPEAVNHSDALGVLHGPAAFRERVYEPFRTAFPDVRVEVVETVAAGDVVVARWRATGTHTGPGLGMPPTGRPIDVRGMTWIRYQDGKMVEGHECWNLGGLLESLRS